MKKYPCIIKGVEQKIPNVPLGTPIYANAVVVDNLVFVSGMTAQTFEDGNCLTSTAHDQTIVCYTKLKKVLEEAGSCLENLVRTLVLFKDMKDYPVVRAAEYEFWKEHAPSLINEPPGSTVLQAASLARPEFLVEIEAIAVLKKD
ncbi:MAG: RidA family protein [Clostridiales bacterium]|nr:RidA family protein [Clostridiales bacterium]